MKLREAAISAIAEVLLGDDREGGVGIYCPYRRGRDLIRFFHDFGSNDRYPDDMAGSRMDYAERKVREYNGQPTLRKLISSALNPAQFVGERLGGGPLDVDRAAEYLNKHLDFDGYEVVRDGSRFVVRAKDGAGVAPPENLVATDPLSREFLGEQLGKCERKLAEGDYDGAITNARALVEATLVELEKIICGHSAPYGGKLEKLYKRIQVAMNLNQSSELDGNLNQILTGLVSVVHGISSLRNAASDSHARRHKPSARHARLAVNAAHTLLDFFAATYHHQVEKGTIVLHSSMAASSGTRDS